MGRYSSSDSDRSRSSSTKRKKKSRKRRSRTPDYDDPYKSHSYSRRRSRSRSTDSDRSFRTSKRKRSRSRDRSYSSKSRDSGSRRRSASPVRRKKHVDAVLGVSTGTLKDIMDIVPGFSKMAPAEQSRIRIQRALEAAVASSADQENEEIDDTDVKEEEEFSLKEQIDRAKAIQEIGDDDDDNDNFLPSHFRSSTNSKKKNSDLGNESGKKSFSVRESSHEIAIFGHSSLISVDEALKQKKETDDDAMFKAKRTVDFTQRDPKTLVAPDLLVTPEQATARWRSKLVSLRHRFSGAFVAA